MPRTGSDLTQFASRIIQNGGVEHVRIVIRNRIFRLDVRDGSIMAGSCRLSYLLAHDERLPRQLDTVRRFDACLSGLPLQRDDAFTRFSRLAMALRAWDARAAGASLRQVAHALWGPGEWPGPGEHRKSAVRRCVTIGEKLVAEGSRPILAMI